MIYWWEGWTACSAVDGDGRLWELGGNGRVGAATACHVTPRWHGPPGGRPPWRLGVATGRGWVGSECPRPRRHAGIPAPSPQRKSGEKHHPFPPPQGTRWVTGAPHHPHTCIILIHSIVYPDSFNSQYVFLWCSISLCKKACCFHYIRCYVCEFVLRICLSRNAVRWDQLVSLFFWDCCLL